jgi:hypothetical protein
MKFLDAFKALSDDKRADKGRDVIKESVKESGSLFALTNL